MKDSRPPDPGCAGSREPLLARLGGAAGRTEQDQARVDPAPLEQRHGVEHQRLFGALVGVAEHPDHRLRARAAELAAARRGQVGEHRRHRRRPPWEPGAGPSQRC